jgi:hypothetical protein
VAAVANAPPKTRVRVVLINDSVITEPTCSRIIDQTKRLLGNKLAFGSDTQSFLAQFTLDEDVLFISRFDSDDGVGPDILKDIHSTFMRTGYPVGILSPFYGNLWYPFAGNGSCGQIVFNAMVRKFPIFQTHAYDKAQLKAIMGLGQGNSLLEFFQTRDGKYFMPYGYGHKHPDEFFSWFRERFAASPILKTWPCGTSDQCVSECHLFFFTASSKGIPGIIYTQSGLQSSLARSGHQDVDTLKYHENYQESWEKTSPDVCLGLEYFGASKAAISQLRNDYKKNKSKYEGHIMDVFTQQPGNRGGKKSPRLRQQKGQGPCQVGQVSITSRRLLISRQEQQ